MATVEKKSLIVITKRRRYFVTDKNKIKKICQMHFNLCNLEVKRLILLM